MACRGSGVRIPSAPPCDESGHRSGVSRVIVQVESPAIGRALGAPQLDDPLTDRGGYGPRVGDRAPGAWVERAHATGVKPGDQGVDPPPRDPVAAGRLRLR